MANRIFLTDKEVAAVLEVSVKTIYRMLRGFRPDNRTVRGGTKIDVQSMKPDVVNGVRRWHIGRVASVLGIGEEAIIRRIS